MIARGYSEQSIKYHLSTMANRSRSALLNGDYHPPDKFTIPLVMNLHPATTVVSKFMRLSLEEAYSMDPVLPYLFPQTSLCVAFRKLPNLQVLLCTNDQNSLVSRTPGPPLTGYSRSGCNCLVCKASTFSKYVQSPSLPGYAVKLRENTTCWSGPSVIYHLVCHSGRPECRYAHYVGRATSNDPMKRAMGCRWSTHKSHFKNGINKCKMTDHLLKFHRGEDPQTFVKIQILESSPTEEQAA